MHNFLTEVTADCTDVLVVKPQKVMPNPGRKNQIVHSFEDGRDAVVAVSNTSIFEVELQWTYVSEEDRSTIFELFHNSTKANGSARSFYWYNPIDGYVYTVRFLTPLRTVYKPGILRSIETVRFRVLGATLGLEYSINLGDVRLATVDDGAMFFHDTEDFSTYAGASGNTPFKIVFTDSGGLTAEAWCGEVGGGEALGDQLCLDPNFLNAGAWAGDFTISGGQATITNPSATSFLNQDIDIASLKFGLVEWELGIDAATTLAVERGLSSVGLHGASVFTFSGTGTKNYYSTVINVPTLYEIRLFTLVGTGTLIFNSLSLKQVTDIPATGLKLYSTKNGTTQSMGTTDAGFNPNAITKVDIYG